MPQCQLAKGVTGPLTATINGVVYQANFPAITVNNQTINYAVLPLALALALGTQIIITSMDNGPEMLGWDPGGVAPNRFRPYDVYVNNNPGPPLWP